MTYMNKPISQFNQLGVDDKKNEKKLEEEWEFQEKEINLFKEDPLEIKIEIFKERMEICKKCESLKFNFCVQCHCFMPLKTRFKVFKCPLNKW
jgi:hypothetical protein